MKYLATIVLALLVSPATAHALTEIPGPGGCVVNAPVEGDGCADGQALWEVHHITISPDGQNLYTASGAINEPPNDEGSIGTFSRSGSGEIAQTGCIKNPETFTGLEGCRPGRNLLAMRSVEVSPDGRFVYGVGFNGVSIFRRGEDGSLQQLKGRKGCVSRFAECRPGVGLWRSEDIGISRDGRFAYTVSTLDQVLATFSRDPKTGLLKQLPGKAGCIIETDSPEIGVYLPKSDQKRCIEARAMGHPRGVTISRDGKFLYVAAIADAVAVFSRNPKTGEIKQLSGKNGCVDHDARFGCARARGLVGSHHFTLTKDGRFGYVSGKRGGDIQESVVASFRVNPKTGLLKQLKGQDGCINSDGKDGCAVGRSIIGAHAAALSPDEKTLYNVSDGISGISIFDRNPKTGGLTQRPGTAGCLEGDDSEGCALGRYARGPHFLVLWEDFLYVGSELSRAVLGYRR